MTTKKYTFYGRAEYFAQLEDLIVQASSGERVMVATMAFSPEEPAVQRILRVLMAAARRGASVSFVLDSYPLLIQGGARLGPLFYQKTLPNKLPREFAPVAAALKELSAAGVNCVLVNRPMRFMSNPFAGRSHLKYAVIGTKVFVGSSNLDASSQLELMVGWDDQRASDWIDRLNTKILATENVRRAADGEDASYHLTDTEELIMDAGVAGRSLILGRALKLIDEAERRIILTCQYFPNDVTAARLSAAHKRGVKVEIYYNQPEQHTWPHNWLHGAVIGGLKLRLPASFFEHSQHASQPFLHAKLLASERSVIIGSHNYITAGVRFGTAEVALESHDPSVAKRAIISMLAILSQ